MVRLGDGRATQRRAAAGRGQSALPLEPGRQADPAAPRHVCPGRPLPPRAGAAGGAGQRALRSVLSQRSVGARFLRPDPRGGPGLHQRHHPRSRSLRECVWHVPLHVDQEEHVLRLPQRGGRRQRGAGGHRREGAARPVPSAPRRVGPAPDDRDAVSADRPVVDRDRLRAFARRIGKPRIGRAVDTWLACSVEQEAEGVEL